jgi:hypothetical protein
MGNLPFCMKHDGNVESLQGPRARVREIRPEVCYVGYDSKKNYLPEPELAKVEALMKKLKETTNVRAKTIRRAWWEDTHFPMRE